MFYIIAVRGDESITYGPYLTNSSAMQALHSLVGVDDAWIEED